jgi:hypothetical protein
MEILYWYILYTWKYGEPMPLRSSLPEEQDTANIPDIFSSLLGLIPPQTVQTKGCKNSH